MTGCAVAMVLGDAAPLVGRLAFATVFLALTVWLLVMPRQLLGEVEGSAPRPLWRQVRTWAVAIAALQCLVYLLWR